jgi:GntR family transcriptional regulator, transcriptional repressor for pyruvate dehydrogenase complex
MSPSLDATPLRVVSRERLADRTGAALREYIIANHLAPGTRLPAETSLATSLGVSRNVLRQAVAALQALGMLRVEQGSGTYVADVADADVFRQIAAWMGSDVLHERDYLEVRGIWERGIYEQVMKRALPADFDRLDITAAAMVDSDDPDEAAALHGVWHDALLHATHNAFLVTMGTILSRFFWEFGYRDAQVRKPPPGRLLSSHIKIAGWLRDGDRATIERMIGLHLEPHLAEDDTPPKADRRGEGPARVQ